MTIKEITAILSGKIVCGTPDSPIRVAEAFASDLMSDVLTLSTENPLLITGLNNLQTIRTAEMAGIGVVVIARGKKISEEMIQLAGENEIILIETDFSVFKTSGLLYETGIKPIY